MCAKAWAPAALSRSIGLAWAQTPEAGRHPTFARVILIPRLRQFTEAYPEIDIALQVSIPLLDVIGEDADLMVRFGAGHYADVEHIELARDTVTPLASPSFIREHGPFERPDDLEGMPLLRSPLEPWRTWFAATGLDMAEPNEGSQFNDIGLMCDAASASMGIALVRHKLGAPWLENGTLVRLFDVDAPSPRPLPVLEDRHHGPLGMRCLR
jgi:DNA-binding transcriptional LysR family regulator